MLVLVVIIMLIFYWEFMCSFHALKLRKLTMLEDKQQQHMRTQTINKITNEMIGDYEILKKNTHLSTIRHFFIV